jgi:hypothetical protein
MGDFMGVSRKISWEFNGRNGATMGYTFLPTNTDSAMS